MNDYSHLRQGRTWERILLIAFTAALLLIAAKAHGAGILPLPSAPPQGWCYATTSCAAPNLCTYNGVQACQMQPPGADYCGQVRIATVATYGGSYSADLARFENLLGKASASGIAQPFPAAGVSPYIVSFPKAGFIAAKFTVPATIAPTTYGSISIGETWASGSRRVAMSLSPSCGFAAPPPANCSLSGLSMGQGIAWKVAGSSISGVRCGLIPGQSYFLNIRFDPVPASSDTFNCSSAACKLPLVTQVQR